MEGTLMSKSKFSAINRRNFVKLLPAGAAGLAAPRIEGMTADSQKSRAAAGKVVRKWRLDPHRPKDPNVRLVFLGLALFCYNDAGECEIAFHRNSPHHALSIEVFKRVGTNCNSFYGKPVSKVKTDFVIGIGGDNDVSFYYQGSVDEFDRSKGKPNDFRWLLDLEDDANYPAGLDKKKNFFKTKLHVQQGTFYTVANTNSSFKFKGGLHAGDRRGHIARCVACEIVLPAGKSLLFKQDGTDVLTPSISGDFQWEIYFRNECSKAGGHSCDKGDFNLVFDALDNVPGGGCDLELDGTAGVAGSLDLWCTTAAGSSDEAPCMGAGFGQSGGFPSAP
jgi:hypothetical protein